MNRRSFIKALVVLPFALGRIGTISHESFDLAWRVSRTPIRFRSLPLDELMARTLHAHRAQIIANITGTNPLFESMRGDGPKKTFVRTRPYFDENGDFQLNKVDR